eukprot:CAMPEP_0117021988 /NCGR_PEP_ID=MMETSP0472-20121206/16575_1 /TAXON_ID=693140 ORGANISM="Tiarina fusus, Strain LIS" /NCGR_SAMPLE_ID=MMETSP0472 /ASSEMBLY_ACC=CAM_ASM_000603 /LENGTH=59 /DNA_ID=CAMNT_0004727721 /DNA_START=374 /DNA_END=553 /DNA_ORIENTATION=+
MVGGKIDTVGQEENKFGFGSGKAPKDAKPTSNLDSLVAIPKDKDENLEKEGSLNEIVEN